MQNVVVYARYSSDKQTEQSIEGQLRVCKEYAEKYGYIIVNQYIDRAMTGTKDNRPGFLQMIEDAKLKNFEGILVYKLDRFARNQYDSVVYKHKLKQYGVRVISTTEAISDSPEGRLVEGLLEMMAEMYSTDLSQKTKRGMKESMIKGNFIGGHILYGYKVLDKKIAVDEEKAPAIRYLFEQYAQGKPKKQIIEELNNKGYRTNNNKLLSVHNFQNNLTNIKYTGVFDNGIVKNLDYYPAIISKDLFDKVQIKLKQNKHSSASQKAKAEYLLTGKVFCGHCGSNMVGVSGTSRQGISHYYYACNNKLKHTCIKKNEQKQYLEKYVIEKTVENVLNPKNLEIITKGVLKELSNSKTNKKIKEFEKRIQQIDKDLDKCFNALFCQDNDELQLRLKSKADSLVIQKKDLANELKKLKLMSTINHNEEDIAEIICSYISGNIEDINYQRKLINNFINSIFVFDDKIVIYYNLFDNKTRTLEEAEGDIDKIKQGMVRISNGLGSQKRGCKSSFFCSFTSR